MNTPAPSPRKRPRPNPPEPVLLRPADVVALTGIRCHSTLRDMAKRGEFPAPVRIGKRGIAYRSADVRSWIDSRPLA